MEKLEGSCLCGQVRYEIEGDATAFYHCHCQRCRKTTGTGHASNIRIKAEGVNWVSGQDLIRSYKVPEAERFKNDFCSHCGSALPRHFPHMDLVVLPAGTLDSEPPLKPGARIFSKDRVDWSCSDELAAFDGYPE